MYRIVYTNLWLGYDRGMPSLDTARGQWSNGSSSSSSASNVSLKMQNHRNVQNFRRHFREMSNFFTINIKIINITSIRQIITPVSKILSQQFSTQPPPSSSAWSSSSSSSS